MSKIVVIHSMLSGKGTPEKKKQRIIDLVESALGTIEEKASQRLIAYASSIEDIKAIATEMIQNNVRKIAIDGGDGFTSLFVNKLFQLKAAMKREDYHPDVLFLPGGTGNAVSFCANFKNPVLALKNFYEIKYKTERMNLLEVNGGERTELTQFISFGADGEIISIYNSQKLRGFLGYLLAVMRYSLSRKLYNPFSRNDANYKLDIVKDGAPIHTGRYEGGGVSAIPFVGYGFRPYPLATDGNAHMRFVIFGAWLMPTLFLFTRWAFLNRPNRFVYDNLLTSPATLDFSFSRPLHVQVAGDLWEKLQRIRVEFSQTKYLNIAKRDASKKS